MMKNSEDIDETPTKKAKVEECLANKDVPLTCFKQWMQNSNILISDKVDITTSSERYGMIAVHDIDEGEVLFTIPKDALLWSKTSKLSKILEESEELESDSGWCKLITCLMFEYKDKDSNWKPYLDLLPSIEEMNQPMFWKEDETNMLLQGTHCNSRVSGDLVQMENEFNTIVKPFIESNQKHGFNVETYTFDLYKHMVAIVMAYSFTDEDVDEGPKMVPLADLLNHVSDNNACLQFYDDRLEMIAVEDIKAGEDVHNTYGQLDNARLLQNYGFVEKFPLNIYDVVEIQFSEAFDQVLTNFKDSISDMKEKEVILDDYDILDDYMVFGFDGLLNNDTFWRFINILKLNEEQIEIVKELSGDEDLLDDLLAKWYKNSDNDEDLLTYDQMAELTDSLTKKIICQVASVKLNKYYKFGDNDVTIPAKRKEVAHDLVFGQSKILEKVVTNTK